MLSTSKRMIYHSVKGDLESKFYQLKSAFYVKGKKKKKRKFPNSVLSWMLRFRNTFPYTFFRLLNAICYRVALQDKFSFCVIK